MQKATVPIERDINHRRKTKRLQRDGQLFLKQQWRDVEKPNIIRRVRVGSEASSQHIMPY